MAGLAALYSLNFNNSSPWYVCPNGEFIEPLDILHCLFPNEGRKFIGENTCFVARPFRFKMLLELLPSPSRYYTPEDFVDGVIALMILSVIISVMIFVTKVIWSALDPNFRNIHPPHKKVYVLANLSKAVLLAILTLSPRYWAGSLRFYDDKFLGIEVKRCGVIYIATDFVALFLVPKLPKSTLFHHVTTTLMAVVVTSMDLTIPGWNGLLGVAKMGVLYGLFSSVAFPVNAYLALRVVYPKAKWLPALIHLSLCMYLLCCALNWGIHIVWVFRLVSNFEFSIYSLLYLVATYFMVSDDIVLIKWLIKRGSPVVSDDEQKKKAGSDTQVNGSVVKHCLSTKM